MNNTISWYSVLLLASSLSLLRTMGTLASSLSSRTSDLGRRDETVSTLRVFVSSSLLRRLTMGVAPDFADLR